MYAYGKLFPDDGADSFEERVYADFGADGLLHPYLGSQTATSEPTACCIHIWGVRRPRV